MQIDNMEIIADIALQYLQMTNFEKALLPTGLSLGETYAACMIQPGLIAKMSDTYKDEDTIQNILDYCIGQANTNETYLFIVQEILSGRRDFVVNLPE